MTSPVNSSDQSVDFQPWLFSREPEESPVRASQREWKGQLASRMQLEADADAFISQHAGVFTRDLRIGQRSGVALGVQLWGSVSIGSNCIVNAFATVRGNITLGDDVRIASHAQLIGFNHSHEDVTRPVSQQGLETKGITIGNDVWIGAGAIVLDGVTVGDHSIIAAGTVVTKNVAPYSIMVENPARRLRDRREPKTAKNNDLPAAIERFAAKLNQQWADVLNHHLHDTAGGREFRNVPGAPPTLRAWCDAVEIAALQDALPPDFSREELIERIASSQDPATGLFPNLEKNRAPSFGDHHCRYPILAAGYALECLGSRLRHEITAVSSLDEREHCELLDGQPWSDDPWGAGDFVDALGTALYFNRKHFNSPQRIELLFGWLQTHIGSSSGVWGWPDAAHSWLKPVNGFYRITRGTYAQFGIPLPIPEKTIDTVLAHVAANRRFVAHRVDACNILDIVHPLWLCGRQTSHRKSDCQQVFQEQLVQTLGLWQDGEGFPFAPGRPPSLQGTEMWLSVIFVAAEALGHSRLLGYMPRGVHRPYPL
jgi:acetyltransferase-like isoleucine patch superfamily enzyme